MKTDNSEPAGKPAGTNPNEPPRSSLTYRWISALLLVPVALFFVWTGGWVLTIWVCLAGALMVFEWHRLLTGRAMSPLLWIHLAVVLSAVALVTAGAIQWAAALLLIGALAAASYGAYGKTGALWPFLGVLYTTIPCTCFVWLRALPEWGAPLIIGLLFVVWATDTGAYLAGTTIGGPKLVPKLSPSKTWAGLGGGIFWAVIFGLAGAYVAGAQPLVAFGVASALMAVVAQTGDLVESALKRHFHAKDTSGFIPGHGGVLDRLDGLMFAVVAVAIIVSWSAMGR